MCFKIVFGLKLSVLLDLKNRCAMVALGGVKGIRDADQVWPGTRKTSLPRQRPSGTPAKSGRVHQENFAGAPRSRKASGTPAEHLKSPYPANFAGGRSRPEASEGLKHAAERFRGLGRRQGRRPSLTGYQENFAGGRSRPAAASGPMVLMLERGAQHFKFISDLPLHLCPRFL